jgi:uncharacterized membrane protein
MSPPKLDPWLILAFAGGMLYPPLAYFGMAVLPPAVFVLIGLTLVGVRLWVLRQKPDAKAWQISFLIAAVGLTGVYFLNAHLAMLVYPVAVSLSAAAVFGVSLLFPPPLVERIARLSEPDLPPSGVIYTRRVTVIWAVFLLINAFISAATALWGTPAQWTLWNGLVSYLLMGTLFAGEMVVRKIVRR